MHINIITGVAYMQMWHCDHNCFNYVCLFVVGGRNIRCQLCVCCTFILSCWCQ